MRWGLRHRSVKRLAARSDREPRAALSARSPTSLRAWAASEQASGAIVLGEVGRRWCPGSKARDAGCGVRSLHRIQGVGALGGREIALEERVVIDGALGLVREDGGGNAWGAMHRSTARPRGHTPPRRRAGVSAPRR